VAGGDKLMDFYSSYKGLFDAAKDAIDAKSAVKTVVLGEQFTLGAYPCAIINAEASSIATGKMDDLLDVCVNFSVVLIVREYEPKDWFADVISVMVDMVDAVLTDSALGGKAKDCYQVGFAPGEIKFQDKFSFVGVIRFKAVLRLRTDEPN
jgi:hypothetical protein